MSEMTDYLTLEEGLGRADGEIPKPKELYHKN